MVYATPLVTGISRPGDSPSLFKLPVRQGMSIWACLFCYKWVITTSQTKGNQNENLE